MNPTPTTTFYVPLDPVQRLDMGTPRDMTYEEKTALSRAINKLYELNSANLDRVVKIIHENLPNFFNDDNPEIEIDINSLDRTTLWELCDFVQLAWKLSAQKKIAIKNLPVIAGRPVPLSGPAAMPPIPLSGDAATAATEVLGTLDLLSAVVGTIRPAPVLLQQVRCVSRLWRDAAHNVIKTALTDACGGGGCDGVSVAVVQRTPLVRRRRDGTRDRRYRALPTVPMARVTLPTSKRNEVIARLGRANLPEALKGIVLHKWRGAPEVMEEKRM